MPRLSHQKSNFIFTIADHRNVRLRTDVNITGHQARTEPKDYTGIPTRNTDQRKGRKQTQRNTEQVSDLL